MRHIRKQYEPDGQTDEAIRFLKDTGKGDEPFALFVSWGPPHDPWDAKNVRPDDLELFRDVQIPKRAELFRTIGPGCRQLGAASRKIPAADR